MRPYKHLPGYLHRWQVFSLGRLRVRIHEILSEDRTPFLHTHPFNYCSIVLSGGYTEQYVDGDMLITKSYRRGSVIFHESKTAHRITSVTPGTRTLFITWLTNAAEQGWTLFRHPNVPQPPTYFDARDGVYQDGTGFRKRHDGVWYALRHSQEAAQQCDRLSIHQDIPQGRVTCIG